MSKLVNKPTNVFFDDVAKLLKSARSRTYQTVNSIMVETYWQIGRRIVEQEQKGKGRAQYGDQLVANLSKYLTDMFGKGFSEANIKNMRQFYVIFPNYHEFATQCVANVSWTNIRTIMRIQNKNERDYYLQESFSQNWSSRVLERHIKTGYYRRLFSTQQDHFYLDLVFYNYLLKCFVVIDLKTSHLTHADIGQMDMYVRMFDALKRGSGDNPTIGIILCADKSETMAKYSVLKGSRQLFASKYKTVLPTEDELVAMMARENQKWLSDKNNQKKIRRKNRHE